MTARRGEAGAVLMMLLAAIGLLTIGGAVFVVPAAAPAAPPRASAAERRVARLALASHDLRVLREAYAPGAARLLELDAAPSPWLIDRDPYGSPETLLFVGDEATGARVASRGPDGVFGTADDVELVISEQTAGRRNTRDRLRVLRALVLRSEFLTPDGMSAPDVAQMRASMADWATAARRRAYLTGNALAVAEQAMADAATAITALASSAGAPSMPARVTGPGGLLAALGLPDSLGQDGFGRDLEVAAGGVSSTGWDGIDGTRDDF